MSIHWEAAFALLLPLPWIGFALLVANGGVRMRDGSLFTRETKPGLYKALLVICALVTTLSLSIGIGGVLGFVPIRGAS